jgi:dTMP kinase
MAIGTEAAVLEVVRRGPPRFITVEGIDGCGKTTVAAALVSELEARGVPVVATREPTDTWLGEAVKRGNEEDVSPFTEVFLFLADRADHTLRIREWLAEGNVVVSDRYADSTYAYQAASLQVHGMGDALFWLKSVSAPIVEVPDMTLLLMLEPSLALARIADRPRKTKFEDSDFLSRVSENYVDLASQEDRFIIVDAERPLAAVIEAVKEAVFPA